jgi:hypothetical protein
MGLFDPISTAETGVNVSQTWLDAISDNIANMNDTSSTSEGVYQTRFVVAGTIPGRWKGPAPAAQAEASIGGGTQVPASPSGAPTACCSTTRPTPWPTSKGWSGPPTWTWATRCRT